MSFAQRLLILLLAATPVVAITNDVVARHVTAFAAAAILAVAALAPQNEIKPAMGLLARFSLALLFPVFWMILQIIPLPFVSLANPIWSSASIALNEPSLPLRISLDPGATLHSLFLYLTILSSTVATVIVGRDRRRVETILLVLGTVTTFLSLEMLLSRLDSFAGIMPATSNFVAIAALGTIISGAILVMVIERYLTRLNSEDSSRAPLLSGFALGLIGLAICLSAMNAFAPSNVVAATGLGFAAIIFVAVARRIELGAWTSVILFATFTAIAAAFVIPRFESESSAGLAKFATLATAESLAVAKRAISDVPWLGNGVGTFSSLVQIYQDFGRAPILGPASTAIAVAVEWGKPALAVLIGLAILLVIGLLLGAVRRGRDSFFPSAAAASVLVTLGEAFCDSSLFNLTVQIVLSILIGLGISHIVGRTTGSRN